MYFRNEQGNVIEGYHDTKNGVVSGNFWNTRNIILVIIISLLLIYLIYMLCCKLLKKK